MRWLPRLPTTQRALGLKQGGSMVKGKVIGLEGQEFESRHSLAATVRPPEKRPSSSAAPGLLHHSSACTLTPAFQMKYVR